MNAKEVRHVSEDVKAFLCIGQFLKELCLKTLQWVRVQDFAVNLVANVERVDRTVGLGTDPSRGNVEIQIRQSPCDPIKESGLVGREHIDDRMLIGDVVFDADFDVELYGGLSATRPSRSVPVEEIADGRLLVEHLDKLFVKPFLPGFVDIGAAIGRGDLKGVEHDAIGPCVGLGAEHAEIVGRENPADL